MTEKNSKISKSVNVQSELKEVLSIFNIKGISYPFNAFYSYFEDQLNYLHDVFKHKNCLSNTSISITEDRTNMINNFVKEGIVANFSEGIRFIFLLGICELKRTDFIRNETIMDYYTRLLDKKNKVYKEKPKGTTEPGEEMQDILNRVISIEEYNKKNNKKYHQPRLDFEKSVSELSVTSERVRTATERGIPDSKLLKHNCKECGGRIFSGYLLHTGDCSHLHDKQVT